MKTIRKEGTFDCVKMKNDIHAKIYAETKDMSSSELLEYFNGSGVSTNQQHVKFHRLAV